LASACDDPMTAIQPADACNFAGVTWVKATTFDDGSYDNCGDLKFTVRRMSALQRLHQQPRTRLTYGLFDTVCNKGTITRTFRVSTARTTRAQCTQRVVVNYEQDYFVKFPNDVIVTECDGTGNYGEPIFFGEDCELLGVSHEDEIFTVVPDACFKIERTWRSSTGVRTTRTWVV
jgi:hypothetical protein